MYFYYMNNSAPVERSGRLGSIDFTRGLVIVIMALDHIRDLLYEGGVTRDPLDLANTTPVLFMTRFITHFCAPVFVFLSGTSAFLMTQRQANLARTSRFLLTRGLWLIFLEVVVVGFGIWTDIKFRTILFQVIFAIGAGFIALSALIRLPSMVLGLIGLSILLLHDALPALSFPNNPTTGFIWTLLFQRGFFSLGPDRGLIIGYALVPWLGVMLAGFGFGRVFDLDSRFRARILLWTGCAVLLLFLVLRIWNLYGDPSPWTPGKNLTFSLLSFLNVSKYPPSLLYTSVTLGPMFLVLWLAEGRNNRFIRFFVTYGRVPMFFYLLHWYLVHASMYVIILCQGVTWQQMPFGLMNFGRPAEGVGLSLFWTYVYWLILIAVMYPLCRGYGRYKATHPEKQWLAYL